MKTRTQSLLTNTTLPPTHDVAAGEAHLRLLRSLPDGGGSATDTPEQEGLSALKIRSIMNELCSAIRSALDDERVAAEDCLRRASQLLQGAAPEFADNRNARGGLCPWQIRKVTSYIDSNLEKPIRNEDLAALVRLNPSHFARSFRTSVGEPPHEYLIRRRVERAQGLMLSTDDTLSEIALTCGLADQSHLTRLFRRLVGESPGAWRRARVTESIACG